MTDNPYQAPTSELNPLARQRMRARIRLFSIFMGMMLLYSVLMYAAIVTLDRKWAYSILAAFIVSALLLIRGLGRTWAAMEMSFAVDAKSLT